MSGRQGSPNIAEGFISIFIMLRRQAPSSGSIDFISRHQLRNLNLNCQYSI